MKNKNFLVERIFYILCLVPLEYLTYSVNYLYIIKYARLKFRKINSIVLQLFIIYVLVSYIVGMVFFIPHDSHSLLRQLLSCISFCSGLFLLFIKFDESSINNLLFAAFISSLIYSIWVLATLIIHVTDLPINDIYQIKDKLRNYVWDWPQTYVPFLNFAFIWGFSRRMTNKAYYLGLVIILLTIFLTFTRSAYLSLGIGLSAYFFICFFQMRGVISVNRFLNLGLTFLFTCLLILILFQNEYITNALFSVSSRTFEALINFITNSNPNIGSDFERTQIMQAALKTATNNLLTGTGFGGMYLYVDFSNSTHNQYLDTLLKIGLIGLLFMIYVFIKLLNFFAFRDSGVFAGIICLIIYGLFNSIYQQPYLMCLLFSLLSYVDMKTINIKKLQHCYEVKNRELSNL